MDPLALGAIAIVAVASVAALAALFLLVTRWKQSGTGLRITTILGVVLSLSFLFYPFGGAYLLNRLPGGQAETLHLNTIMGSLVLTLVGVALCIAALAMQGRASSKTKDRGSV